MQIEQPSFTIERPNHYEEAMKVGSLEELANLLCKWECNCDTCNKKKFCNGCKRSENGWMVFLRRDNGTLNDDLDFMEDI